MKFNVKVKLPGEDIIYSYEEQVPIETVVEDLKKQIQDGVLKVHRPKSFDLHLIPVFNNVREVFLEIVDPSDQVPDEMKELITSDLEKE